CGARRLALDSLAGDMYLLNDFVQEFVFVHHNYGTDRPRAPRPTHDGPVQDSHLFIVLEQN
ncbi:jg12076, partial [Pararge aegeria aegeria]